MLSEWNPSIPGSISFLCMGRAACRLRLSEPKSGSQSLPSIISPPHFWLVCQVQRSKVFLTFKIGFISQQFYYLHRVLQY